ncbi:MAG TPA: RNA-directed DNA polymerase [Dysgonomonas sp.]|uniref:antiviral reverse transcriptase Drt3a n=1 Tax=unclassified Dysgonomonas TaxID=2630389 RepID=UPI0024BD4921|nr:MULTISPECIES: antiviral reverse transcriptase Drt3a [unclassified Dysgonomonas]HML66220.1 RNA-directed DNA polymerase [Dysgonomonas sp.]
MNQNFSSQQLMRLCKQDEWEDYDLTKDGLLKLIDENFEKIISGTFEFQINKVGDYYLTEDLPQKLILRKLNDNLKRLYKDEQANRRIIIRQVKTLLEENGPMWILKTDIEKFYESIDKEKIISKLKNDSMLSFHSLYLIDKLFSNDKIEGITGIPRGLNISATLSEIYMRKFDRWVQRIIGVYYYARFVDDIVIFSNDKSVIEDINKNINFNLEKGLKKKEKKTAIYNGSDIKTSYPLEYLGYRFTTTTNGRNKSLSLSIAEKKVKKIKSRIIYSFLDYLKNADFDLLEKRIKFLTGNFSVKKSNDGNELKAGLYYNYSHITDLRVFDELNIFYRKLLYSRNGSLGIKLNANLSSHQRDILSKYSFKHGFLKKVYISFTFEEMSNIKKCW